MLKYDSYKDSGVEWIGEIPNHWSKTKISYYCEVKDGTHNTPKYVDDGGYPLVTQKDITKGKLDFTKTKNISQKDYSEINKRSNVEFDDIIMSMIGSIGNPSIVDTKIPFSIKNVCLFKTSQSSHLTKFIHYYLSSNIVIKELDFNSRGGVQGFVSLDVLRNLIYIKPPIKEQQQIVSFLDTKTSLIDSLIEKTQRKIELLKEKRTSLINHVVTKGLNPNVELKDSGVEWIREIPIHWNIGKLKNNSDLKISSVDKHILENERKVIVCNYTDVYYNEFITSDLELRKGSCSESEYENFLLNEGDVIITKDSESPTDIGVPSLVKEELNNVVCGYHLSIIKSHNSKLLGGYLFRQLQTKRIRSYFEVSSNGITRFGLGKSSVLETILILPPLQEQQQIVEYLDEKTTIIDTTIKKEEKRVELLKEYRQSLISEVVTGKIKVTN